MSYSDRARGGGFARFTETLDELEEINQRLGLGNHLRREEIIGQRVGGEPKSEGEHFMKCGACGGYFDMRDLGNVFEHEGPLPHPAQDMSDSDERIHPDSRFGVGS